MDKVKQDQEEVKATTTGEVTVDWLELHEHLTSHILSKLISIYDYARFGVVCVKWRSILLKDYYFCTRSLHLHPQLPLLIIPLRSSFPLPFQSEEKTNSFSFYRVTDGKIFNRLQFTMPYHRYIRGSGYGWLITVDQDDTCYSVQLMNPFFPYTANYTTASIPKEIKLPLLTSTKGLHIRKVVLSADPISNPKDIMVMTIFSHGFFSKSVGIAFCKPGDEAWAPIDYQNFKRNERQLVDLIYYEGKFYVLRLEGTIVVCNVAERTSKIFAGPPPLVPGCYVLRLEGTIVVCNVAERTSKIFAGPPPLVPGCFCYNNYLVVSAGEFFQVRRYLNGMNSTKCCEVLKLKVSGTVTEWIEVKDLGDRVFFVGHNHSMSISPTDFPGCKPNCIYYTDGSLFQLEKGNYEQYCSPTVANVTLQLPPI